MSFTSALVALLLAEVAPETHPTSSNTTSLPAASETTSAQRVDEIVVTGSRTEKRHSDSTAAVELISRREIEASGAETVSEILETHPGIELERTFRGYTVRMQGLDPEYVLVLVNGERTQGRLGGALDLSRFPLDAIERIEIFKGAGSALHGSDAVAGVVNIITRRAKELIEAGGHVTGGTLGALDVHYRLGTRRDEFDVLVTAGHHRAAAWDLTPETAGTTSNASKTSDVAVSAAWRQSPGFILDAKGEYLRRDQEGLADTSTGALLDQRTRSEQASVTLAPHWRGSGGGGLRVVGHYGLFADQFLSDQRGSDALDQFQKTREHLGKLGAQYDVAVAARHLLTTGAEVLHERMRSPRLEAGRRARTRGSLFVQHEWRVTDRRPLTLLPGLRLDRDSQFGPNLSPKIAARFDPFASLVIRAAYGWGYRAPSFQELYIAFNNPAAGYSVGGNPALKPERSRSITAGGEWRALDDKRLLLSIGTFRNDIQDLILVRLGDAGQPGQPSRYSYANVATARTQGLELTLSGRIAGAIHGDVSYTLTDARDHERDRPLEGQARHRGTFRVSYRHAGAGFAVQGRGTVVGQRPFYTEGSDATPPSQDRAAPYVTGSVRISQVLWKKTDVFAGGDNLFNAGDERYHPVPPRTFYAGLNFGY